MKNRTSQTKIGGMIWVVPDTGPFAFKKLRLSPWGRTLEFSVGNYRGFYQVSYDRAVWMETQ